MMPPTRNESPRQQRAVATRASIVKGAAKAIVKLGYAEATLAAIGKETKISNGALYFHFETREAVALAVLNQYRSTMLDIVELETAKGRSALDTLIGVSFSFAQAIQRDPVVQAGIVLSTEHSTLPKSATSGAYTDWIHQIALTLTLAKRQGAVRADLDVEDLSAFLAAAFTGIQMMSAATSKRKDLSERVRTGWEVLLPSFVQEGCLPSTLATLEAYRPNK